MWQRQTFNRFLKLRRRTKKILFRNRPTSLQTYCNALLRNVWVKCTRFHARYEYWGKQPSFCYGAGTRLYNNCFLFLYFVHDLSFRSREKKKKKNCRITKSRQSAIRHGKGSALQSTCRNARRSSVMWLWSNLMPAHAMLVLTCVGLRGAPIFRIRLFPVAGFIALGA